MLYVSTKNNNQSYTAYQALTMAAPSEDDLLVPMRLPFFNETERNCIFGLEFSQAATHILNKFFPLGDKASDIQSAFDDLCPMFGNLDRKTRLITYNSLQNLEDKVAVILTGQQKALPLWAQCAIRISLLFGIYGQLDNENPDFAICAAKPLSFLPVLIGKAMGLPMGNIISGAECEDSFWSYMCKYITWEEESSAISHFVVSSTRANELVKGVLGSYKQKISCTSAFSYGALQDYRAITGENQLTVLLNEI